MKVESGSPLRWRIMCSSSMRIRFLATRSGSRYGSLATASLRDTTTTAAGQVTLHGRGSLHALAAVFRDAEVSELRFRSNIAVEGLGAWEEQSWVGRKVRIGTVDFDVVKPKLRCLATHANPKTGERDLPILTTLTRVFGQEQPTFAVAMVPSRGGGQIHAGDEVSLVD